MAITAEKMVLLAGERSAMVCEIENYPRLRVLHIFLAGGDLSELKSFSPKVQDMARRFGCGRIAICGRRGWERALHELGYRLLHFTVAKDLG